MKDEFDKAMAIELQFEGGKVNDPDDPGGKTNQGITQRTYDAYRVKLGQPKRDVYTMTNAERDAIYKTQYWDKIMGDDMPPGIAFVVFDGAVNSGVSQSVKWLQGALGPLYTGKIDGLIGAKTIAGIKATNDHDALIARILERRMAFLQALKGWEKYKNGWSSRVRQVLATGQAWAAGSVGPNIVTVPDMHEKANLEEAKPLPWKGWVDSIIGGAAALAAATMALQTQIDVVQRQLEPFLNGPLGTSLPWLSSINHWLTVAGIVAGAIAGCYRFYLTNYDAKLKAALDLRSGLESPEDRGVA